MANQTLLPPLDFTPRQERVLALLRLVGPGPAAFFRDALRLIRARESLEAATHLAGHCFREIESALRDVLLPDGLPAEEAKKGRGLRDSHRREVTAILGAYGIDHADKVAAKWLRIADNEDEDGLFRAAHRNALGAPREDRRKMGRTTHGRRLLYRGPGAGPVRRCRALRSVAGVQLSCPRSASCRRGDPTDHRHRRRQNVRHGQPMGEP